ncbi:hypothetical protein [Kitasatospora purpeofusca]|uniref:hypothetical protein n=1 Tax=Kitasatospora purpeofusca TaxID=67352 RepID=UPI00224E81BB|nr:hypothetical protein [Kitasatospora purpeofusca]MCX4755905.1 hypothetical protein [Kitasatospora purpeofusca]WSR36244.1 hypothetical protein OG715_38025 [Kitasatospora purpeofusca]
MPRTRQSLAALALAGAVVLAPAAVPAAAHGDTVRLEVSGQDGGHVTTVATWENDRDPVTEQFAGTLSATSADGRAAGPWRLVAVPGRPGTYTTREFLPAGHWRIVVDCAFPSLGHGERELDVEAAVISDPTLPTPTGPGTSGPGTSGPGTSGPGTTGPTVRPTAPGTSPATATAAPGTAAAATESADSDGSGLATWVAVGTAAVAVALVTAGLALRRRARRP